MPFTAITQDQTFAHSPVAGSKVAVHFPETFKPDHAFALCFFLHGRTVDNKPFENHIKAAIAQMKASSTNTVLVAPRFGDGVTDGRFTDRHEYSAFVAELGTVLPRLLTNSGMEQAAADHIGTFAATKAPIVLVAFSGAWKPLNAILKGLLALDPNDVLARKTRCADRVVGIALLDSIYGPISSSGPLEWQKKRRQQTALLGIYSTRTQTAEESNEGLISKLEAIAPVEQPASWEAMATFPADTVAFFKVGTDHQLVPSDGPPVQPIAKFVSVLGDRLSAFAAS